MPVHRMRKFLLLYPIISGIILFNSISVSAQKTAVYTDRSRVFTEAMDLYRIEKYGAAQERFEEVIRTENVSWHEKSDAAYFGGMCAMNLFHPDAENRLKEFIEKYPESNRKQTTIYQIGRIYYRQKNFKKASEWFEKTDIYFLSEEDIPEYYFKTGYSYFRIGEYDKASKILINLIDINTPYFSAANYYYGHIAYQNKSYDTAVRSFLKLRNDEVFSNVVPYYIAQIYYLKNKDDSLISFASAALRKSPQNATEIGRMLGEAYYRNDRYAEAVPLLLDYEMHGPALKTSDYYELGYACYKINDLDKAIKYFSETTNAKDTIAQHSYYILGDCFIRQNKKQNALNAFKAASAMDFDPTIKEESLYDYAKLTYEISYQPLAIDAFQQFIKTYPHSTHLDEANSYLVDIFMSTNNFRDALAAIEKIKNKSEKVLTAYQKVSFNYGVELYNDGFLKDAQHYFGLSLSNPVNAKLVALGQYWMGEIQYKSGEYDVAIKTYKEFSLNTEAHKTNLANLANYNVGYCYYKKASYSDAQKSFRIYLKTKTETDSMRYNDACIRIGDCYFMSKEYDQALEYYGEALNNNARASDYALYQKGMILGIQGKHAEKTATMAQILSRYTESPYIDDALYQIGNSYLVSGNGEKAMKAYKSIVADYPNSNYVKSSLLSIALIYTNDKNPEKALQTYKQLVADYPSTPEAREAVDMMKNIYIDQGKAKEFIAYVSKLPFANISRSAQDSLLYEEAEMRYMKGDCDGATGDFINYLEEFGEGYFALNANYYKAECDFKANKFDAALHGYMAVVSQPTGEFTREALLKAGYLHNQKGHCDSAVICYKRLASLAETRERMLDAQLGLMRCNLKLGNYKDALQNADTVKKSEKAAPEEIAESHLVMAKCLDAMDSTDAAIREYEIVVKTNASEKCAEARYTLGLIQFKKNNYKKSQEIIFALINQVPTYDYWIAKGFILLADDYMMLGDAFQAKHTLKSIIENYKGEDLKSIAQKKLDDIQKKEDEQKKQEEDLKIQQKIQEQQKDTLFEKN